MAWASAPYSVVVSNYAGSVTSAPATLTVYSRSAKGVVISQIYGGGGNGTPIPTPNASSTSINISGTSGKLALVTNQTALSGSNPPGNAALTPLNGPPAAAPLLSLATVVSNQFQFTLTGTAGSNYVIEVATNLPASAWTPVQTGAAPILFVRPATNDQQFYRGKVQP